MPTRAKEIHKIKHITTKARERQNGHKGMVVWLTGLPASGKSTIAQELEHDLFKNGIKTYILDGDQLRKGLSMDLAYTIEDRMENVRRAGEVAKFFREAGFVVICAFISPDLSVRQRIRSCFEFGDFIEVFVDCPVDICERRDPKGLYAKVRKGEIKNFTGISAPYEKPLNPEIHLKTNVLSIRQSVNMIKKYLKSRAGLTHV